MAPAKQDLLSIGEVAMRSGVATSALRFYESTGLISSERTGGGHRLYRRHVLRRIAFIRVAQRLGLSLEEIGTPLMVVPQDRAPTKKEMGAIVALVAFATRRADRGTPGTPG